MARLTMVQTVRDALAAGLSPSAAATYGAVSQAESGLDDAAQGDVALENATWGPSVGEPQIRTLRAATGTGSDRDLVRLLGHPLEQAKAAADISGGGRDWTPWTTFRDGAYQRFLPAAQAAVATAESTPGGVTTGAGAITAQPAGLVPSAADVEHVVLVGLVVLLGVGLIAAGAIAAAGKTQIGSAAEKLAMV